MALTWLRREMYVATHRLLHVKAAAHRRCEATSREEVIVRPLASEVQYAGNGRRESQSQPLSMALLRRAAKCGVSVRSGSLSPEPVMVCRLCAKWREEICQALSASSGSGRRVIIRGKVAWHRACDVSSHQGRRRAASYRRWHFLFVRREGPKAGRCFKRNRRGARGGVYCASARARRACNMAVAARVGGIEKLASA